MAQTYQMKHNAQGAIYSLLTVESDGQMTMTFHGTDREISHEVTENADGWLCYPGAMFPGLESGRWIEASPAYPLPLPERRGDKGEEPKVESETNTNCTNYTNNEPCAINPQPSSTMKAIGMVAAATVALFVIYETGLLIPLGLIGLATGGLLK